MTQKPSKPCLAKQHICTAASLKRLCREGHVHKHSRHARHGRSTAQAHRAPVTTHQLSQLPATRAHRPDDPHARMMLRGFCWGTHKKEYATAARCRQAGGHRRRALQLAAIEFHWGTHWYKSLQAHTERAISPPCVECCVQAAGRCRCGRCHGWCARTHTTPPHADICTQSLPRRHGQPAPHPHTGLRGSSKAPPQPPTQQPCRHSLGCRRVATHTVVRWNEYKQPPHPHTPCAEATHLHQKCPGGTCLCVCCCP